MADLHVNVAGVEFSNPLIAASGTFGFGREYAEFYPLSALGGVSSQGITRIDIRTRRPIIHNNTGGFSGPALLPIAVRMVWQTYQKVKIPIVGLGGISTWQDAVEMLLAGATALQIGTVLFTDPYAPVKIAEGLSKFMDENGVQSVSELTGAVQAW